MEWVLTNTYAEIVTLDRLNGAGDLARLAELDCWPKESRRVKVLWHDLRATLSESLVSRIGKVSAVFHFAASSHVDNSIRDPALFVMDNVVGSTNLMLAARAFLEDDGLFFNFSTDEVFGTVSDERPRTESDCWRPSNPYAASKCGQTAMGHAFWKTYGLPVVNTFAMNNFGERQHPEKYLPKVVRALLRGETLRIHAERGRPGRRTWIHAKSTAHALWHLFKTVKPGSYYSIVGDTELDNLEIAQRAAAALDLPLKYEIVDGEIDRRGYDGRYLISGEALKETGWVPPVDFDTGFNKTVRWMAANPEWLQ